MMRNKIISLLDGVPAAIAADLGRDLLALDLPTAQAMAAGPSAGPSVERFVVQSGLAVMTLRGILTPNNAMLERYLGWSTYFGLTEAADELAGRADVNAVALIIDSPGGLVVGTDQAATAIAALNKVKPVHAIAAPTAASAAYWVGSQARELSVTPGGVVGSIGVALQASSIVGPDNSGEQWYSLTSTNARAKRPDPATAEGMQELQRSLDAYERDFHAAVSAGRNIPAADLARRLSVTDDVRDGGATYSGADAISRGLADRVETQSAFLARLMSEYGRASGAPRSGYRARAAAAAAVANI